MSKSHLSAALLLAFTVPAFADPVALGDVTVTATRTPLIADQEVAPVIVIGAQQLQLAAGGSVAEVLRQYAGLDIATSGGPGQPASLFIRGTNSNQTLVLINGVRINPTTLGGAPLENIRLQDIERIEIVKGPRASLYGSDAIGGVVNIITKPARTGFSYDAHAGAGRYGTYDSGGSVNYGAGDSALSLSGDDYHTDGFPTVAGETENDGTRNRSLNASGHTRVGAADLGFTHWQSNGSTQYLGTNFLTFAPQQAMEDFQDAASGVSAGGNPATGWHSGLNLSHMLDNVDQRQPDPFNTGSTADFLHSQRNIADWQNDFVLNDQQLLTAGVYSEGQHAAAQSFGLPYDVTDRVNAVYGEDDFDLKGQRLVLAARDTRDQGFGNHLTWNLDYGYELSNSTRFTAGAGTGFRAPNAADRFGFDGNPNLAPETSQNVEIGLREKFGENQDFSADLFQDKLNELIVFQPTPTPTNPFAGENQNVGRARVRGLELGYTLAAGSWEWRNDAVLQNPEDLDSGTYLLRRARRSFSSNLGWHDDATRAGLGLLLSGPRSDVDLNGAPAQDGGYVLLTASLHRQLAAGFALLLRIDNLLDSRYQTANGYNTAGRSLFLQLEYQNR